MPSAFISYRRQPSAMLATLIARELTARGIGTYLDTRQTDGGGLFPERLLTAIEASDVFVCLVAAGTFESDWVRREIEHAHTLGKVMVPVFQESYTPPIEPLDAHVIALLQHDGVHVMDVRNIYVDEALNDLAQMIALSGRTADRQGNAPRRVTVSRWWWGVGATVVIAAAALVLALLLNGGEGENGSSDNGDDDLIPAPAGTNEAWDAEMVVYQDVNFVYVPSGCFQMGTAAGESDAAPPHIVCLDEYWIGEYPVTVAEYNDCMQAGACSPPVDASMFNDLDTWGDYPVTGVNWDQAHEFAEWLDVSLLTEAQWEYAARGPESWRYPSGDDVPGCDDTLTLDCTGGEIVPVDTASGTSWVGAYGMAGGVWEWVMDWYGPYPAEDWIENPTGADEGDLRVVRGGAFDMPASEATATVRVGLDPATQSGHTGFRVGANWDLRDSDESY